jgi:hypothetical protein
LSNATHRFATPEPTVSAVCRRRAMWLGFTPLGRWMSQRGPIIWLCDDTHCHRAARIVYKMPNPDLDALEEAAALEAGTGAGGYLEEIGTTDLAKLTDQQWREFLRRLFVGFEQVLRRKILEGAPPF